MHQFKHDGEYLHDHHKGGHLVRLSEIDEVNAYELLSRSTRVKRNDHVTQTQSLFMNKGFVLCDEAGDQVIILYNHDGKYQLWLGRAAYFIEKYRLSEVP